MYPYATSAFITSLRFFVVCALLLGAVQEGYGQRVYAVTQQSSPTQQLLVILSQVTNQARAVDNDTLNYSTLSVTLGALGAITANQNLQFGDPKPTNNSPVILKFGSTSSLLNLLGGISVQRTNGGRTSPVAPSYSGTQLLNLLNLLGGPQIATAIIPSNGLAYDGVRLEVNTTLGGVLTANYYYAFYIKPPELQSDEIKLCEGQSGEAIISNFHIENGTPYTYRLFSAQTGGTEAAPPTNSATLTVPSDLPAGSYWLEARENDIYPSARTEINVSVSSRPPAPTLNIHPNSQH